MSNRTIRVLINKQADLYAELLAAMNEHVEYDGCFIMQYTEYPENGEAVAKFTLRDKDNPRANQ
jgi:hypothetical protein